MWSLNFSLKRPRHLNWTLLIDFTLPIFLNCCSEQYGTTSFSKKSSSVLMIKKIHNSRSVSWKFLLEKQEMAIKLFQNSSRIQLPYAFLKKFWLQDLKLKKELFAPQTYFILLHFSLACFNFSGLNFFYKSKQTAPVFFKNSGQNSTHKNSWLHLIFQKFLAF